MIYLKNENLEDIIDNDLTLVDYYADWCGPCQMLSVELEEIPELKVIKVNTDEHQKLAVEKGIMTIPYVEIYKNKKIVNTFNGFKTKDEIKRILETL